MIQEIGYFKWESGSINDNIRKLLVRKNIMYMNTMNGNIKVNIEGKWLDVKYILENPYTDEYRIYAN